MPQLERRMQILLDDARYQRLVAESERTGRSMGALIRDAVDQRFPDGDDARMAAAGALLAGSANTSVTEAPGEGPAELKAVYAAALDDTLAPA